ncbi:ester cyclase [Streptomyces phaeochromogenes]|uniref:ester cyclase n=1 Tax=Streptomyces phaeochromogenes TaxID=1923 RepID=UPI002DD997DC|nr:ester cyclase [Streptomyces phaeochromogenes]WRZ26366.1 ester cyclase [Streptomyces phaeochromogenes]WSJ11268.1 ester cyclase [Streptomyces phaeochromogenes]
MSDAELRDFFQRYIDALNAHELHRMTEFIHAELIMNGHPVTRDDVIADQEDHTDAVPDFTWRVKDLAIDGDRVAARLFNQGTPTKEWFGVPPTGATVEYAEYAFHKVRDGRFYEMNYLIDAQAVQRQLVA